MLMSSALGACWAEQLCRVMQVYVSVVFIVSLSLSLYVCDCVFDILPFHSILFVLWPFFMFLPDFILFLLRLLRLHVKTEAGRV